jgi:PAS domain S-box-containing protein
MMRDEPKIVKQLRFEEKHDSINSSELIAEKTSSNEVTASDDFFDERNIPITYKKLLDNANILIQSVTPEGKFLYVNSKWLDSLGYSKNDLSHLFVWDIIREDHHQHCQNLFSELMAGRDFVSVETVFLKKSNEPVFVTGNINVVKENGKIVSTIGFFQDVTQEKQLSKDYEVLFNESSEALIIFDIETGKIHDVNMKMCELFDYSYDECLSLSVGDISSGIHPYTKQIAKTFAKKIVEKGVQTYKWQVKHKNGNFFWIEATVKLVDLRGQQFFLASVRDITKRVCMEQKLKDAIHKFQVISNSAADAIIMMDSVGKVSYWNPAAEHIFGYKKQDIIGKNLHKTLTPSRYHEPFFQAFNHFQRTGLGSAVDKTIELAGVHKDGFEFPVELSLSSVKLNDQWHAIAIIRDISKRKEEESKLQTFSEVVKQNSASIVITDSKGAIEYVNPKFESVTGYSFDEVKNKNPSVLKSGKQSKEFYQELWDTISQGEMWHGEFCNIRKNNESYWEEAWISPILDSNGDITHYVAIKEDITDKKQLLRDLHIKENAIKSSINGMMLIDFDGNIVFVNHAFLQMWKMEIDKEIRGKPAVMFWKQPGKYLDIIDETIQGGGWVGEMNALSQSNEEFIVQLSAHLVMDEKDKPSFIMTSFVDITNRKKAEAALRESEEKFRQISENMGEVFWLRNADNTEMIYISPAYEKVWGRSCESLYENPQSFIDTIFDEDKPAVFAAFEQYMHSGEFNLEYRIVRPDGDIRWIHARSYPVTDNKGNIIRHTGLAVDVTEQKKLQKDFQRFKMISDQAGYGTLIHDKNGVIQYVNKAFVSLHGYQIGELIGNNVTMFFNTSEKDNITKIHRAAENDEGCKGREIVHIHKNGNKIPLLMSSTFIEAGDPSSSFYAKTFVDMSELKQAQQQVQQHVEEVEMINTELHVAREQLATLNQDLEKRVEKRTWEVQKLLEQKDGFINQLGHDLRTPLTPMLGLLPLLGKRITDEKGLNYISMINRNIHFMKDLVNKTITFAKLNSDKIEFSFTKIELLDLIENIHHQLHATLEKEHAQLDINVDPSTFVFADEMQLSEVFHNLISNALKYDLNEKETIIEISAEQSEKDQVIISIRDNGIGMTPEQVEKVFDEFYKADDARTDVNSHGLGLNICKRIIEKHDGKIWVESEGLGKGSTFCFTLKKTERG